MAHKCYECKTVTVKSAWQVCQSCFSKQVESYSICQDVYGELVEDRGPKVTFTEFLSGFSTANNRKRFLVSRPTA